jgi:rod shape-determining protein MreD
MGYLLGIPFMAGLAVLQASALSHVRLLEGRPDLILLAVVGWALAGRGQEAMAWGFTGGLFLDLVSGMPLGVTSIALVLIALAVSASEGRFWGVHPLMQLAGVLAASAILYGLTFIALWALGQALDPLRALGNVVLPGTFLNLLLALPAVQLSESLQTFLFPPRVSV